jgi:hypothetical protein
MEENNKQIIDFFAKLVSEQGVLHIPHDVFAKMDKDYGELLRREFHHTRMMKLPETEVRFFEWLKEKDRLVWNDLWEAEDEPYIISLEFLPRLLEKDGRGFPICDLRTIDNYYFTPQLLVDKESDAMVEAAKVRFTEKQNLSTNQLLALEIHFGGIDIWHFAYKHNVDLDEAKRAAHSLIDDQILIHLTQAEHLAPILEL